MASLTVKGSLRSRQQLPHCVQRKHMSTAPPLRAAAVLLAITGLSRGIDDPHEISPLQSTTAPPIPGTTHQGCENNAQGSRAALIHAHFFCCVDVLTTFT